MDIDDWSNSRLRKKKNVVKLIMIVIVIISETLLQLFFGFYWCVACGLLCTRHGNKGGLFLHPLSLLGRRFDRVDLIKPVSNVRPSMRAYVRACMRTSVCSKKFL